MKSLHLIWVSGSRIFPVDYTRAYKHTAQEYSLYNLQANNRSYALQINAFIYAFWATTYYNITPLSTHDALMKYVKC